MFAKTPTPFEGQADAQRGTKKGSLLLLVFCRCTVSPRWGFRHLLGREHVCWSGGNMHYAGSVATVTLAEHWVTGPSRSRWLNLLKVEPNDYYTIHFLVLDSRTQGSSYETPLTTSLVTVGVCWCICVLAVRLLDTKHSLKAPLTTEDPTSQKCSPEILNRLRLRAVNRHGTKLWNKAFWDVKRRAAGA